MSCCLAVANLMVNLMAENYMYMWVVPIYKYYILFLPYKALFWGFFTVFVKILLGPFELF